MKQRDSDCASSQATPCGQPIPLQTQEAGGSPSATRPRRTLPCILPRSPLVHVYGYRRVLPHWDHRSIAFGTDTEGDRISVRTAVETGFPGSIVRTVSHAHYLRSTTLLDLTTATTSSRRAYATLCYYRPWLTFTHASLRPQQTCICPYIFTPATPATRLSLPTAHQLQPAPPITGDRPITRPACTDSSRLPARLRPAAPPV